MCSAQVSQALCSICRSSIKVVFFMFFLEHACCCWHRFRLRRLRAGAEAMEMMNLKLYLENRCIIAENERLRERATALRRENLALRQNLSKTAAEAAELPAAGAGAGAA